MCLAVPGKIISIDKSDPVMINGRISFGGVIKEISLAFVPHARVDDYVIVHAGFALSIIDEEEAGTVFEYLNQISGQSDFENDKS